jgi:hypothetical protein
MYANANHLGGLTKNIKNIDAEGSREGYTGWELKAQIYHFLSNSFWCYRDPFLVH